jgi:DNA repair protein RadA/Sms
MVEESIPKGKNRLSASAGKNTPLPITSIGGAEGRRYSSGSCELDRVLGGGILPGSLVLVAGEPGIGKSSIMLQMCAYTAEREGKVLYISGEESTYQIKMRAERLGALHDNLYLMSETDLEAIETHAVALKPSLLVIDSIQSIFCPEISSAPGSVSQVRESTAHILSLTKRNGISTFIIGHVTKDGSLAGPRVLEHMVDTVLYFEGDPSGQYRILRAIKNRFGSTNEIGLFEMETKGLKDVPDAAKVFLDERPLDVSGSVVVSTIEGTRPFLVEVQALVCSSALMQPRRTAEGIDIRRIQLLLAVLEKRAGMLLGNCDVYMKTAGGLTVNEPAVDLGLAVALASSFRDCPVDNHTVIVGEVGLSGEVRAVAQADRRIMEAEKRGFKRMILPKGNHKTISVKTGLDLIGVETVSEVLNML